MSKTIYRINGKQVTPRQFMKGARANGAPMRANTYRGHDPLISEALGCMKAQVPKMRRLIETEGIQGVRVRDSGQLEITSRRGRKKLMHVLSEIRGYKHVDQDGGYGD